MKKKVTVEVSYLDFVFDNLSEAEAFADMAVRAYEKPKDVQIVVNYVEEGEDNE